MKLAYNKKITILIGVHFVFQVPLLEDEEGRQTKRPSMGLLHIEREKGLM